MKTFRKILFWSHLVAGLAAGLAIGVMCFTGTLLAFEKELVAWAERDARHVEPPAAGTPRLTLDELQTMMQDLGGLFGFEGEVDSSTLMALLDANGDGGISWQEWSHACAVWLAETRS